MTAIKLLENPGLLEIAKVAFAIHDLDKREYEAFRGVQYDPERVAAELYSAPGPKWALFADDYVLCVAGFIPVRPGVWDTWMLADPRAFAEFPKQTTENVRWALDFMLQNGAHRLQCLCLADRIKAQKWYRTLGLSQESLKTAFGAHGEDALMFVKLADVCK